MSRTVMYVLAAILSASSAAIHAQVPREWPTYPITAAPAELRPANSARRADHHLYPERRAVGTDARTRRTWTRGCHSGLPHGCNVSDLSART